MSPNNSFRYLPIPTNQYVSDNVFLSCTQELAAIENSDLKAYLNVLYNENTFSSGYAAILNALYTEKTLTFSFSRKSLNKLIEQDKNSKASRLHNRDFTNFARLLISEKIIEVIKNKTNKNQTDLYMLVHPKIRSLITSLISKDFVQDQKTDALKLWKKNDSYKSTTKTLNQTNPRDLKLSKQPLNSDVIKNTPIQQPIKPVAPQAPQRPIPPVPPQKPIKPQPICKSAVKEKLDEALEQFNKSRKKLYTDKIQLTVDELNF